MAETFSMVGALNAAVAPARYMPGSELDLEAPVVKVMTQHSAKGLEFPTVVVAGLEDGVLLHSTFLKTHCGSLLRRIEV